MPKLARSDVERFATYGTFAAYQQAAALSADYPGKGTRDGLKFTVFGLGSEAGEISGHLAKAYWHSDGGAELTSEQRRLLKKEIGDVLWYLAAICGELGINMEEAAADNLSKLADRIERGVLRGNGDER